MLISHLVQGGYQMKLSILIDNTTISGGLAEWGFSCLIEENEKKILFDLGKSDLVILNAQEQDIDLQTVDYLVFSHGHYDHTWGLEALLKYYQDAGIDKAARPTVVGHPLVFASKQTPKGQEIGSKLRKKEVSKHFRTRLSDQPIWLTDRLVFLGEIERKFKFEALTPQNEIITSEGSQDDYLLDDTALVFKSDEGLVIITGCSHSGICNIVEYAKKVCQDDRILDVIGGLHLLAPSETKIQETVEYFQKTKPQKMHICHCTDLPSKIALAKVSDLQDIGVGLKLNYEINY